MSTKMVVLSIAVIVVLGIVSTLVGLPLTGPPSWLTAWTAWIGSVVGIFIGSRVFWLGANALNRYLTVPR